MLVFHPCIYPVKTLQSSCHDEILPKTHYFSSNGIWMMCSFYRVCFTNRNQRITIIIPNLQTNFTGLKRVNKIPEPSTDTERRTYVTEETASLISVLPDLSLKMMKKKNACLKGWYHRLNSATQEYTQEMSRDLTRKLMTEPLWRATFSLILCYVVSFIKHFPYIYNQKMHWGYTFFLPEYKKEKRRSQLLRFINLPSRDKGT